LIFFWQLVNIVRKPLSQEHHYYYRLVLFFTFSDPVREALPGNEATLNSVSELVFIAGKDMNQWFGPLEVI
jgi:hypothetical protein